MSPSVKVRWLLQFHKWQTLRKKTVYRANGYRGVMLVVVVVVYDGRCQLKDTQTQLEEC